MPRTTSPARTSSPSRGRRAPAKPRAKTRTTPRTTARTTARAKPASKAGSKPRAKPRTRSAATPVATVAMLAVSSTAKPVGTPVAKPGGTPVGEAGSEASSKPRAGEPRRGRGRRPSLDALEVALIAAARLPPRQCATAVMHLITAEFKARRMRSGRARVPVHSRKQAVAIGLSKVRASCGSSK